MSKRPKPPPEGFRAPRLREHTPGDVSHGEDAVWLAERYRLIPDEWQAPIVCDWLTVNPKTGKWAHGRCGLAVPRQNGKNAVIEIRELYGMVVLGEAILHTAHELKTARKAFKRLKYFFGDEVDDDRAKFPDLNALVKEIRSANGQEAIFLKDVCETCDEVEDACECEQDEQKLRKGGSIEVIARSAGSGRGFTVDVIVIDEAQHLSDEDLEAILPAKSSAPRGDPQVIYTGTPPNREKGEKGEAWIRIRTKSTKKGARRVSWTEYGVPDGPMPDIDDIELLYATNPSLGIRHANGAYGLTMDAVRDDREDLSDAGYARERYGWWGDTRSTNRGVINMTKWAELKIGGSEPTRGLIVIDVSPNLEWSAVGVATDGPDDRVQVLVHRDEGDDWVVERVAKLKKNLTKVLEVALTPAAHIFAADLTALKIESKLLTTTDVARGCTAFQTMVKDGSLAHVNQQILNDAARTAVTRYVGTSGLQVWDDAGRKVDITPLNVVSIAAQRWAAEIAKPTPPALTPRKLAQPETKRRTSRNVNSIGF